mmetsp:Transcript_38815/g.53924  ORF Transcript_38815/g.53924 Transcript_38815/m.53924 type:complete len:422 (-) Transcript_38815:98-1363(-)
MFPQNMKYLLSQHNVSRNTFKIEPRGSTDAKAGSIITCVLPTNTLVDMDTFAFWFDMNVVNSTDATRAARFPNKLSSLIERIDVSIGGKSVSSFNGYNVLTHIKDTMLDKSSFQDRAVSNHEHIVGNVNEFGVPVTTNEGYTLGPSYGIRNWYGFLGECSPRVLDTSLLPEVQIRLTLATNDVCIVADTYALAINTDSVDDKPNYSLSNMSFSVDTLSFSDGSYEKLVASKLEQDGYIEIPFKSYMSTRGNSGTTRFSVSSQSVDKLYAVIREQGYDKPSKPVAIKLGSTSGSRYTDRIAKYFKFSTGGIQNWQWKVNGVLYPQYVAGKMAALDTLQKMSPNKHLGIISNIQMFLDTHFIIPYRLNATDEVHELSGYDTRQSTSAMEFTTDLVSAGAEVYIFAEYTSVLKVGMGQQVLIEE